MKRSVSSALVTSAASDSPPTAWAVAAAASPSRSSASTFAPAAARRRQVARPISPPAPVTMASRPVKRSADTDQHLADIAALEHGDERLRCVLEAVDDRRVVLDAPLAQPSA